MNRSYLIAAIALGTLVAGLVLYFFVFSNTPAQVAVTPQGSVTLPQVPQSTAGSFATTPAASAPAATQVSSRLVKISSGPIVPGEVVVNSGGGASSTPATTVYYLERQSGNVYTYQEGTGATTRTSNRTIPGIQSALWLPDGSAALIRYLSGTDLSTINTYLLPQSGAGGFFLAQNLAGVAVSSSTLLTLASGVNGSTVSTELSDGSHAAQAFATPLSQISVQFAGKGHYLVVTKASGSLDGAAFLSDSTGHLTRIAGPARGLTALASPSGKWVLVGAVNDSALQMELINSATGAVSVLPIATFAEKCVWTSDELSAYCAVPTTVPLGAYPDDWYQGAAHLSDRIWRIDTMGHYAQLVVDLSAEAKIPIDAQALAVDKNRSVLVFVNKTDGSLWSYSL